MLTIGESTSCGRRDFLRIGGGAIGGLSLASLLSARACANEAVKDRSVVFLNLQGGPTQFETFDPKMQAPAEIRSITGAAATPIPGVALGGSIPRIAALADRLAIVRSYRHGISSHGPAAHHVMAGGNPSGAMMGALYAAAAGLTNPQTGIPRNSLVIPAAVDSAYKDLYASVSRVSQTGQLSSAYKPFDPSAGGEIIDNMRLQMKPERLDDRRSLLRQLDRHKRFVATSRLLEGADRFQQQAFDVLTRGAASAFDLSQESPATIERYDTSMFAPSEAVKKRNAYAKQFSPLGLGKQLLLARRLCQAGCGFVTVTCGGWDMHGGGKEFTMVDGLSSLTPAVDKAVSAFIEDVQARGLTDDILLVITGEFGRTPRINKNGGRDHWGNLCTLAFSGGGLPQGVVVGRSDRNGGAPVSDPVSSSELLGTIMNALFDLGGLRLESGAPQEVVRLITAGKPIPQLV
ncbi:MAG: DUF1501 domain-containing protein [Pirellulaceae bacterium]|jgi:hypothetical protein|nr:DUF1501 domain-containing protein [Pirellulaceae bacterium]